MPLLFCYMRAKAKREYNSKAVITNANGKRINVEQHIKCSVSSETKNLIL